MPAYNYILSIAFSGIFFYTTIMFAVQFFILRKRELIYYSLYLLCGAVYYLYYFSSPIFPDYTRNFTGNLNVLLRMTLALFQIELYTLFTIAYLNINSIASWVKTFFKIYLWFIPLAYTLYLVLYFMQVEKNTILLIFNSITIPMLVIYFFAITRIATIHANIYLMGTLLNMAFTVTSFLIGTHLPDSKISFHLASQMGLLLDLFFLSYGLSLKAAEADKKLVATLLESQHILETERSRFARDLHDGLGGLLSSVKYSFSHIKETISLTAQQTTTYEQTLHKLDGGIAELRNIAHNMMPENLQQFGLDTTLRDLCSSLGANGKIEVIYQSFGMAAYTANTKVDLAIYRMAQEILHNTIKHSAASRALLQLSFSNHILLLTAEDNGKGFDTAIFKTSSGTGFKSMQSRTYFLNAKLQIESSASGTAINIEIPL